MDSDVYLIVWISWQRKDPWWINMEVAKRHIVVETTDSMYNSSFMEAIKNIHGHIIDKYY